MRSPVGATLALSLAAASLVACGASRGQTAKQSGSAERTTAATATDTVPRETIQVEAGPPPRILASGSAWTAPEVAGTLLVEPDRRYALHATVYPERPGVTSVVSDQRVLANVPPSLDLRFLELPEFTVPVALTLEVVPECEVSLALYGAEAMFVVGYGGACDPRLEGWPLDGGTPTPWRFEGEWAGLDPLVVVVDGVEAPVEDVRTGPALPNGGAR